MQSFLELLLSVLYQSVFKILCMLRFLIKKQVFISESSEYPHEEPGWGAFDTHLAFAQIMNMDFELLTTTGPTSTNKDKDIFLKKHYIL